MPKAIGHIGRNKRQIGLRLDEDLFNFISEAAYKNNLSFNSYANILLRKAINL